MTFCEELGLSTVQLKGDAKVVIQEIKKSKLYGDWYGEFIKDIKVALEAKPNYSLVFNLREGNCVTYVLANLGFNFLSE